MRPWTIVVLSDYGRDRNTYQAYERLFEPELPARSLPISNPAVLRMQATFAMLDWLTAQAGDASVWRLLTGPVAPEWAERDRPKQFAVAARLQAILQDEAVLAELSTHLTGALSVDESTVRELLWDPPRPLLTAVIPTAVRRLITGWRHLELGPGRDFTADGPLPDFIVSRLFGDLALPEVTVVTPPQTRNEEERREPMRAFQALNVYAPGRVSHRLTITHRHARHWVAPPVLDTEHSSALDVRQFAPEFEDVGVFGRGEEAIRVIRPLTITVEVPPADVSSSSYGRLRWRAEITATGESDQTLQPPRASPLAALVGHVTFYTHGGIAHVEVRRWAAEADVEALTLAQVSRGTVFFTDGPETASRVGVGLALDVDAVCIEVTEPERILSDADITSAHLRSLRVERFYDQARAAPLLRRALGEFAVERTARGTLTALIDRAIDQHVDLAAAYRELEADEELISVLATALGSERGEDEDAGPDLDVRLAELLHKLHDPRLLDELRAVIPALWEAPDARWDAWARARLASSVGAAFHAAIQSLCPEYDADELVVDIEPATPETAGSRVWLTEQTIGGGGILHEALQRIGEKPRRFFDLVAAGTDLSIDETVDAELTKFITAAVERPEVVDALAEIRATSDHESRTVSFDQLISALDRCGIFVCHPVVSALSVRFLRPRADARTDATTLALLASWSELEERFGIDIDLHVFARLEGRHDRFDRASGLSAPHEDPTAWRAAQITSLLWPRSGAVRALTLRAPNPFTAPSAPDVSLLRAHLADSVPRVAVMHADDALVSGGPLAREGEAELVATPEQARELRTALLHAAATAVESGPLLHYPRVDGVQRVPGEIRARLVLDLVGE